MITGKTSSGFEFTVRENVGDDFRLVLAYKRAQENVGNSLVAVADMVEIILGKSGAEALYQHLAEPDGAVPASKVQAELAEIVNISKEKSTEVKN